MTDFSKITPANLISADTIMGTNVYNRDGEKLGEVESLMMDRISGRAVYAIMSFGGILGMGEKHHPLPWSTLKYDTGKKGYVVSIDAKNLKDAPSYDKVGTFDWTSDYGRRVDKYYDAPTAW